MINLKEIDNKHIVAFILLIGFIIIPFLDKNEDYAIMFFYNAMIIPFYIPFYISFLNQKLNFFIIVLRSTLVSLLFLTVSHFFWALCDTNPPNDLPIEDERVINYSFWNCTISQFLHPEWSSLVMTRFLCLVSLIMCIFSAVCSVITKEVKWGK